MGRRHRPRLTSPQGQLHDAGLRRLPAVASNFAAGYADAWLNFLGVLSQANLRANYDLEGNLLPVGAGDRTQVRDGRGRVLRAGQLAARREPDGHSAVCGMACTRHRTKSMASRWHPTSAWATVRPARPNGAAGIPSNSDPIITFDLAGPKNGGKGYYEWDKNNFAPRVSVAWTPRGESGFKKWLTGGDKMVVRAGYSKVFDRIGQGIALNFDQGSHSACRLHQQPVRRGVRDQPRGAFRQHLDDAADDASGASRWLPADAPDRGGHHHATIDDTLVTPSAHMANFIIGRELGATLRSRAVTSAGSAVTCWSAGISRCR